MSEEGAVVAGASVVALACTVAAVSPPVEDFLDFWVGGGVAVAAGGAGLFLVGRWAKGHLLLNQEVRASHSGRGRRGVEREARRG
jgi:hypothetical protein